MGIMQFPHEYESPRGTTIKQRNWRIHMKVVGISFGRKMKNTELLVKEALLKAEENGAEVQFIRATYMDIKPCNGCGGCMKSLATGGSGKCVIKDDLAIIDEAILNADAVIFGAPVYVLGPTGQLKQMADRFGPSHDRAFLTMENEKRIKAGKTGEELVDPRNFKNRFAGLISVGGAVTQNWVSFGLPTMHLACFSSHIKVVDQMDVYDMGRTGSVLLNQDLMDRAGKLGQNLVSVAGKDREQVSWMGDHQGTCPVCHCDLLTMNGTTTVQCPVCGIYGTLSIDEGKVSVAFSEAEQMRSRLNYDGKHEHWAEIMSMGPVAGPKLAAASEELEIKLKRYEGYGELNP